MILIKVSIIVPCYNQAQYLDEALHSVLDQTHSNWECLIINDGSLDETEKIAKNWISKDVRFKYFYKKNGGLSSTRNCGLNNAKGDWIQFLDSDDILDKRKLELSLKQLYTNENEGVKIAISNFRMFKKYQNKVIIPYCNLNSQLFNFESLLYQWDESFSIPIHCGFFEASLFKCFRFPENLKAKEDWVMWVSLFQKGCKALFIDEPLALYRKNVESMTMTKNLQSDQILAYEYFKQTLTDAEYQKLSIVLISRYYQSTSNFKTKLSELKHTNTYKLGYLIKKVLIKLGILKPFKRLFEKIVKLKMVSKYL